MPIDFPNSPTVNQEYTINGVTWKYDGTAWNVISGGPGFRVSSAAPSSPATGDLWLESDSGEMFFYYDNQWVSPAVLASVGTSAIGTQQLASSAVTAQKALTSAASAITGTNSFGISNALARADHDHQVKAVGAFYAWSDAVQNFPHNENTQINFNQKTFDVSGWMNTSGTTGNNGTRGRYTPQLAGIYRFSAFLLLNTPGLSFLNIFKNNSNYAGLGADGSIQRVEGTILMKMNGTTDYVDIRFYQFINQTITNGTGEGSVYFCGEYVGSE